MGEHGLFSFTCPAFRQNIVVTGEAFKHDGVLEFVFAQLRERVRLAYEKSGDLRIPAVSIVDQSWIDRRVRERSEMKRGGNDVADIRPAIRAADQNGMRQKIEDILRTGFDLSPFGLDKPATAPETVLQSAPSASSEESEEANVVEAAETPVPSSPFIVPSQPIPVPAPVVVPVSVAKPVDEMDASTRDLLSSLSIPALFSGLTGASFSSYNNDRQEKERDRKPAQLERKGASHMSESPATPPRLRGGSSAKALSTPRPIKQQSKHHHRRSRDASDDSNNEDEDETDDNNNEGEPEKSAEPAAEASGSEVESEPEVLERRRSKAKKSREPIPLPQSKTKTKSSGKKHSGKRRDEPVSDSASDSYSEDNASGSGSDSGSETDPEEIEHIKDESRRRRHDKREKRRLEPPIELDDEIRSDTEDITTLSRRLRYQRGLARETVGEVLLIKKHLDDLTHVQLELGKKLDANSEQIEKLIIFLNEMSAPAHVESVPRRSSEKPKSKVKSTGGRVHKREW